MIDALSTVPVETILLICALTFGLYTAWTIGANDVANAMGTSVGSGALTLRRAVILAAFLEFGGAFLAGSHVSETVMKGIIHTEIFAQDPRILVYGMLGALLAAGAWLQVASYYGWPVSTTHTIVGALMGFGVVYGGWHSVQWSQVTTIASSWLISPALGGILAYVIFNLLMQHIFYHPHPLHAAQKAIPILVFCLLITLTYFLMYKCLGHLDYSPNFFLTTLLAFILGSLGAFGYYSVIGKMCRRFEIKEVEQWHDPKIADHLDRARKHLHRARERAKDELRFQISLICDETKELSHSVRERSKVDVDPNEYQAVERIFASMQLISASLMAFSHGANDVANAIGPLAAVITIIQTNSVPAASYVPMWVLALGGIGIVVGLATWGWRVIDTIGKGITELTPSRGFAAEFGASTTILCASQMGLPISTTHTLVGAVLGVGLARGIGAINLNTLRDIAASWVITLPAGALLAIFFSELLQFIFG